MKEYKEDPLFEARENANNSAQFSSPPSSTPQSSDKNNGCVVLGFLAMLAFAIFLAYACFAN